MARRTFRSPAFGRTPREWLARGVLALAAVAAGYVSVKQTLAYSVRSADPERAHTLSPSDGRIEAQLAMKLLTTATGDAQRRRAEQLAQDALRREPLAIPAIVTLGLHAQLRGDLPRARRLFAHSSRLSRRDLQTRLWAIEDAVAREDVPGAIRNYDLALRASRQAPEILFPVLSSAIADPSIAAALAPVLASRPPWGDAFLTHVAGSGLDPKVRARFFRTLKARRIAIPQAAEVNVVNALVAANAHEAAWGYYRTLHASADRRRSRDPHFTAQLETPTAFDWVPVTDTPGIAATIQRNDRDGVFDFATPPTVGGVILQQMQFLPPGRYRIEGRSTGIDQPRGARPYWSLVCVDGRELGRVDLPNSTEASGRFRGSFSVSGDCPTQQLRLVARPSNIVSGVSGQIDEVALQPLGDAQ
ncbi:hypothetical protein OK349_17305 [Sphingomonas sp. BT-65]|uniref:tetratricopeptide repeat protein n=1 Tax=Sphingomonas sp. BT-65 TaxID=2989821 RepID=UPI0022367BEA|nr:hypothetical protein [Sphingomonas sp. BT-65]MCW4463468.1 hypothetical protein [Sphingomonas sp. BT-65]